MTQSDLNFEQAGAAIYVQPDGLSSGWTATAWWGGRRKQRAQASGRTPLAALRRLLEAINDAG